MDRVKTSDLARGRWLAILPKFGVASKFLKGHNCPCPACGGRDRFQFTNRNKDGDYVCRKCGAGKGIGLIAKVNGWSYKQAADEIDRLLANDSYISRTLRAPQQRMKLPEGSSTALAILMDDSIPFDQAMQMVSDLHFLRTEPAKSTRDATLWLQKYHPEKLEAWLDARPGLRVWLEDHNNEQAARV